MSNAGLKYRDPKRIMKQAKKVTDSLNAHPLVQWLESPYVQLYCYQNFFSDVECDYLMQRIDTNAQPSTLYKGTEQPGYRTSYSCNFNGNEPEVARFDRRISDLMGIAPEFAETMQGQRYEVGQEFKQHHDYFFVEHPYWKQEALNGGQRTWTAMAYLNVPEAGGATYFPMLKYGIEPRRGMLLIWNNMDKDGKPNLYSLHAGTPVEAGTKYIITKWFRLNKWRGTVVD